MFEGREIRTIENGLDIKSFNYKEDASKELKKKLFIPSDKKVILHVTPSLNAPIKGSRYVVELAKRMPNIEFVIVATSGNILDLSPTNIRIIKNIQSKEELATFYSMADVTVLTSYRESFSMVTAESLCCGTPVVGFKAGAPETIAIPEYSHFVKYGDIKALEDSISNMIELRVKKVNLSKIASERYDAETMYTKYRNFYESILCRP